MPTISPHCAFTDAGLRDAAADRVFLAEQRGRSRLADDEHLRRREDVAFVEGAPGEQTRLERLEVAGTDAVHDGGRFLPGLRKLASGDDVLPDVSPIKERREGRDAGGGNAGQRLQPFQREAMEAGDLLGVAVGSGREHDCAGDDAARSASLRDCYSAH